MGRVSDARINMGNFRNMMNQVPVYNNSLMLQSIDKDMFKID